jgi:hypothetical protein
MDTNTKMEVPVVRGKPRAVYAVDGLSAYELAVKHGFEGTEEEWLNAIVRGEPGYTPKLGVDYFNGESAYELAVKNGFKGTEKEWLASIVIGKDGYTPIKGVDYVDGLSAYEIAQKGGYKGTEAEWLASLNGKDGENGGAFYNDEIPFNQDNPTLGVAYTVRAENYPFVEFSKYKKGNIYSRQWNNTDGTTRKGTALLKYEGTSNSYYSFTLISLVSDGVAGVTPKLRVNSETNYWEVSYDNGVTWESTDTKATGEDGKDGEGGGTNFTTDDTLTLSKERVLGVNTVNAVTENSNKPITSGAVYQSLNTIALLLENI